MIDDYIEPEILMLIKSRIKQHQRKTKTGKITTVREHTDIRTKKMEEAKKNRGKSAKAEPKNSPTKIGRMLASRGVPISQNSKGKQVSGIAIRQSNNGKNIVMEYKDWENKGDRHTVMNQVRSQLKVVGLDISVKDGTEKYYIHTAGANFFGHGDFPDDKPKPKGSKDSRAKMRESAAGIMDMLDRTHSEQDEASKKADADITQEKPAKGGDVGDKLADEAKKYKSAKEFVNSYNVYSNNRNIDNAQKGEIVLLTSPDKIDIWFGDKGGGLKYNGALYGEFEIVKKNPKTILVKNIKSEEEYVVSKEARASKNYSELIKNKITSKEQLTDIWNKANPKKVKKSITRIGNLGNGEFGLLTQIPNLKLPKFIKLKKENKR